MKKIYFYDTSKKTKVEFVSLKPNIAKIYVCGPTVIDDKIIKKMKEEGKTLEEITTFYIKNYKNDMEILNILPNSFEPKATENLDAMKEMIENLLSKDIAYKTDDSVYFDVSKDKNYGSLSNQASDENSQARVEINNQKRNLKKLVMYLLLQILEQVVLDGILSVVL